MRNKWRLIGGTLALAILVFGVMAWATGEITVNIQDMAGNALSAGTNVKADLWGTYWDGASWQWFHMVKDADSGGSVTWTGSEITSATTAVPSSVYYLVTVWGGDPFANSQVGASGGNWILYDSSVAAKNWTVRTFTTSIEGNASSFDIVFDVDLAGTVPTDSAVAVDISYEGCAHHVQPVISATTKSNMEADGYTFSFDSGHGLLTIQNAGTGYDETFSAREDGSGGYIVELETEAILSGVYDDIAKEFSVDIDFQAIGLASYGDRFLALCYFYFAGPETGLEVMTHNGYVGHVLHPYIVVPPVHNEVSDQYYWSIQGAIDEASLDDSVYVVPGTYYENVDLDTPGVYLYTNPGAVIDGGGVADAVTVTAAGTTIEGFEIRNGNEEGIEVAGVDDNTIEDNEIHSNDCGVFVNEGDSNEIRANTIHDNLYYGIQLDSSDSNTIDDNTIYLNGTGIHLMTSSGNTVSNNEVYDNSYEGIYLSHGSDSNFVTDNVVYDNWVGIILWEADENTISGNDVVGNSDFYSDPDMEILDGYGVSLYDSDGNVIEENVILGNGGYGVYLEGSSGNTISLNEIADNYGYFEDFSPAFYGETSTGIYIGPYWDPVTSTLTDSTANSVRNNWIHDQAIGVESYRSYANEFVGNEICDTEIGIYFYDVSSGNLIAENLIHDNDTGLLFNFNDDSLISGNEIAGNGVGVELVWSWHDVFAGNWITGNDVGIHQYGNSVGNQVHGNAIVGNTTAGVRNDDVGLTCVIDAALNWWGDVNGPAHVTNTNPTTGDAVSDNVIYSPWLGIGADADPSTRGWQPVSPMLIIVDDVGPIPPAETVTVLGLSPIVINTVAGYLNRAIGATNLDAATDTIEVRHGTYDASEPITEGVNIVSETGSASNTHLTGNMALNAEGILLGRLRNGFSIHGNVDVGAGVDASTIHINWNNLYGIVTNGGLNTLDATYNYWGAGSGRVGDIDYRPFLPVTADQIIAYMDEHRMDPLEAIRLANLLEDGFSANEAIMIMALGNTLGLSTKEAAALLSEYGWITIQNALLMANGDYETFVTRLMGFGFGGTDGGLLGGGSGGGGAVGEDQAERTYVQGETIDLSFTLTCPITGECVCDPTANLTVTRVDVDPREIVYFGFIPYNEETSSYSMEIDTSKYEPGIYNLFIGTSCDGHNHEVRVEITAP